MSALGVVASGPAADAIAGTVNTMPEKTLDAVLDHGEVTGDTVTGRYAEAGAVLDQLEELGISYADVTAQLEREGVDKFEAAWTDLLNSTEAELKRLAPSEG